MALWQHSLTNNPSCSGIACPSIRIALVGERRRWRAARSAHHCDARPLIDSERPWRHTSIMIMNAVVSRARATDWAEATALGLGSTQATP